MAEGRMTGSNIELPEAVKLFRAVIDGMDPLGDPTCLLRSAREVHVKVVTLLMKEHGLESAVASTISVCAWLEAWKQSVGRDHEYCELSEETAVTDDE